MSRPAEKIAARTDRYPSRVKAVPEWIARGEPVVYGSPADGPLDAHQLQYYAENGFIALNGVFSHQETEQHLEELQRLRADESVKVSDATIREPGGRQVRSIFAIHEYDSIIARLCRDHRIVNVARQILGCDVYIHQSRVNYKPGFRGKEFYWHSDFETWHVEDGMPAMRALSCSISLTPNTANNGPLLVIPGSHKQFLACVGETPENHYQQSLRKQEYGVPDDAGLTRIVDDGGIEACTGGAGMVTFFDCNIMHGSNSNITPMPRSNVFIVFNSVENVLVEPFCGLPPRPQFIANRRSFAPIEPI
ncbi:MAG TPA: ectoine hydroxylase [Gammaproteobacteria bacterium]|nr:ectoine hydroxylase [Gammaproteobacteria bacterium]